MLFFLNVYYYITGSHFIWRQGSAGSHFEIFGYEMSPKTDGVNVIAGQ